MTPRCNDWYKLSDNLSSRWRELFTSLSQGESQPEPPPAVGSGSASILSASGEGTDQDEPQNLLASRDTEPQEKTFSDPVGAGLMTMADRVELAERLFLAVRACKPEEQIAMLEKMCGDDPELKHMVEGLLADEVRAGNFLKHPPLDFLNRAMTDRSSSKNGNHGRDGDEEATPTRLGRFTAGQRLNERFVIIRFIAKGGMGEVYEAEDEYLRGKHVALKAIRADIADDPALQERFEREVLVARELSHPNLCPIHEIFHCDQPAPGFLFLTMRLLQGETLTKRLRRSGPVRGEEASVIARQMAAGLAAIHKANIIHRDIKPNNVMLDGAGSDVRLFITDFGLARALEAEATLMNSGIVVVGTPGYLAPELLQGQPASAASDLFAFGVVLHEAFTGEKPAAGKDGRSVVPSPRLNASDAPSNCIELVKACLDQEPKVRCEAFEQYLNGRRRVLTRRAFLGTAAVAACSLAGTTWWKWDDLENLTHPLPGKRFVALVTWPKTSDNNAAPMLTGVLSAIKGELARLEVFDRNLLVISPEDANKNLAGAARLGEVCGLLGANLALAASGAPAGGRFDLVLRLIDPDTNRTIRKRELTCPLSQLTSLPAKAVEAAASLLNLSRYLKESDRTDPGTQSTAAYTAYQTAEALMKEPNDKGLDAAIENYKDAVELDPRYAIAYAKLAIAYCRWYELRHDSGALDLARGNYERALALNPGLVEGHHAVAALLEETGDEQGALDELAKALQLDPSNPRTLLWQAQLYTQLGRTADAERIFERILKDRPNYWLAYNELGFTLHNEGKYREAIRAFRTASLAAPGSSMALANLGEEYLEVGDFSAAADSLRRCLALDPKSDQAAAGLSLALRYQGKFEEALPFALKAVELNPTDDSNWLELGDCYSSLRNKGSEAKGAYQSAAKVVEQHLKTDASYGPYWMLLALYKVKSGDSHDAVSLVQKAEGLGAGDIDSQLYKARILELLGQRNQALDTLAACFRRGANAVQIAPFPDMESLRRDPRYQKMVQSS